MSTKLTESESIVLSLDSQVLHLIDIGVDMRTTDRIQREAEEIQGRSREYRYKAELLALAESMA